MEGEDSSRGIRDDTRVDPSNLEVNHEPDDGKEHDNRTKPEKPRDPTLSDKLSVISDSGGQTSLTTPGVKATDAEPTFDFDKASAAAIDDGSRSVEQKEPQADVMSQSTSPWQLQGFDPKTAGHVNMFDPSHMPASTNPPGAPTDALGPQPEQQYTNGAYNDHTYPNEWNSNYPPHYAYDPAQEYHQYDHPYQAHDHTDGQLPENQEAQYNPGGDHSYDRQDSLHDPQNQQSHAADPALQNMWPPQQNMENNWNHDAMHQNWQPYHPQLPEHSPYPQQGMYYPQQTPFVPQDVSQSGSAAPVQFVQDGMQPPLPNAHDYPNMAAGPAPNDCVNTLSQPEMAQEAASEQHSRHKSGDANVANDEAPQLFTSSSFSNLPSKPSPFDALESSVSSVDSHEQYPFGGHPENPALLAASEGHSRGSSLGGNVHFTIGSESGSRDSPSTLGLSSEADLSGEKEHTVAAAGALAPDLIAQSQPQDAAGCQTADGGSQHNMPDAAMPPLPSNSVAAPEQVPSRASSVHSSEQSATEHPPYRPSRRRYPSQSSDHSTADDIRQGATQQAPVEVRDHAPAAMPGQLLHGEIPGAAHMAPWIDHSRQPDDYFQQLPQDGAANVPYKQDQRTPDSQPLQQMSTPTEAQPSHQGSVDHPMTIYTPQLTTHPDSAFHPPRRGNSARGAPGANHRTSHDSMGCPKMGLDGPDIIRGADAECAPKGMENRTHAQSISSKASEGGSSIASSEDFPPTSGMPQADIHRNQNTMSPAVTLWKNPEPHLVGVTLALAADGQSDIQASQNDGPENEELSQPDGATTQSFHTNPAVPLNVIDIQQHLQEEMSSMGPLMSPGLTDTSQDTNRTAANVASTGQTLQHAGQTLQKAGQPQQHAGQTQQHTGQTQQHAGQTQQNAGQTQQNATRSSNTMQRNPRIPAETQVGQDMASIHPKQQQDHHPQTVQQSVDNSSVPGSPYYEGAPQERADGTRTVPASVPKMADDKIQNIGLPPAGTYQGTVSAERGQSRIPFQNSQDGSTSRVMPGTTGPIPYSVGAPGGSAVSEDMLGHHAGRMGQRHPSESSSSSDHAVTNPAAVPRRSSEEQPGFIHQPPGPTRDQQGLDNRQTAPVPPAPSDEPVQSPHRSGGEHLHVNNEGQAPWHSQMAQPAPSVEPVQSHRSGGEHRHVSNEGQASWQSQMAQVAQPAPVQVTASAPSQPGAAFDQFVAPLPPGPRVSAERESIPETPLHSAPSQDSITGEIDRSRQESSYNSEKSRHSRDSDEGRSDRKSKDRRHRKDNRDDRRKDKYRDERRRDDRRDDRRRDDRRDDKSRGEHRDDRRNRDRRDRDHDKYHSDQNSGYDSRSSRRRDDKYSSKDNYDDRYHYSSSSSHDSRDPDYRYRDGAKDRPRSRQGHPEDRYDRPKSRQKYEDDYYNRPRSRQGHDYHDRPRSRQGYGDDRGHDRNDRPRSRQDYDGRHYDGRHYYEGDPYYDYDAYYQDRYKERYEKGYYEELQYYNKDYQYPAEYNKGYDDYDRRSQHSHTDDYDRSAADHFARESHGSRPGSRNSAFAADESPIYPGAETTRHGYYESSYSQGAYDSSLAVEQPVPTPPPERLTPAKFQCSHLCVSFGPLGELVRMLPNNPQNGQPGVVHIEENTAMEVECQELQLFPGPLIRGETHKKDVLLFCQKKAREALDNGAMGDRFSAALIWKYLELLIKQNGTVVGTDIGELLLQGQTEHPPEQSQKSPTPEATSGAGSEAGSVEDVQTTVTTDRTVINKKKPSLNQEEVIHRFRDLLLHGHKKDALEWAMRQNDWGNAFFLAAKMDAKTHASVMTRFANQSMKLSDPLQTLYQLMSGRQPAAVSLVADEKWGDWRPHLAMILSNAGARPDLDKKAITTLGDTLASKRLLHSSQFCYLMAHVSFGHYSNKAAKLVLVGSDHSLALHEFLSNDAIQCTEVYEYAQSLASPSFQLIPFQTYKYLYAVRLSEMGLAEQALHYCEVISRTIQLSPGYYNATLVSQVYELANRLKYCDPQRIQSADEIADPDWLIQLQQLSQAFVDGAIQPLSGTQTPLFANGSVGASSEQGDSASGQMLEASQYYQQQQYPTDPTQAAQQSYTGYDYQNQSWQQLAAQPQEGVTAVEQQQVYGDQSYLQQQQQQQQQQQAWNAAQYGHFDGSYLGYAQQQQQQALPGGEMQNQVGQTGTEQLQGETARFPDQQAGEAQIPDDDPNQLSSSLNSNVTGSTLTTTNDTESADTPRAPSQDGGQKGFDYYGTSGQVGAEPSMPLGATASDFTKPKAKQAWPGEQDEHDGSAKLNDTKTNKEKKDGGGLFGFKSLLSRFSRQKNEIKLPDDKNPKIVWDPDKQKWINTDGDETDASVSSAPPPKDSELTDPPSETPEQSPLKPSPSAANRFSLQKGRGARSQYVDVLAGKNVKPSPIAPSNLFNVLPKSQSVPANLFVPSLSQKSDVTDAGVSESAAEQPASLPPTSSNQLPGLHSEVGSYQHPGMQQSATQPEFKHPANIPGYTSSQYNQSQQGDQYGQSQYPAQPGAPPQAGSQSRQADQYSQSQYPAQPGAPPQAGSHPAGAPPQAGIYSAQPGQQPQPTGSYPAQYAAPPVSEQYTHYGQQAVGQYAQYGQQQPISEQPTAYAPPQAALQQEESPSQSNEMSGPPPPASVAPPPTSDSAAGAPPAFYNPTQFSQSNAMASSAPPAATTGPRYGQRRVYPKK